MEEDGERQERGGTQRKGPEPRILVHEDRELGRCCKETWAQVQGVGTLQSCRVPFPVGQEDRGSWREGSVLTSSGNPGRKGAEPLLLLLHKSRLLTRKDQIVAVK